MPFARRIPTTMVFITIIALHVSGDSSAHYQELKTVYTASGICRAFTASYRLRLWVGTGLRLLLEQPQAHSQSVLTQISNTTAVRTPLEYTKILTFTVSVRCTSASENVIFCARGTHYIVIIFRQAAWQTNCAGLLWAAALCCQHTQCSHTRTHSCTHDCLADSAHLLRHQISEMLVTSTDRHWRERGHVTITVRWDRSRYSSVTTVSMLGCTTQAPSFDCRHL